MRVLTNLRTILLAGAAIGGLAACTDADVASPGSSNPIQPIVVPPGGGSSGVLPQNNVPGAGCPAGTVQNANVNLGDNVQRAFCVLQGAITSAVTIPASNGLPVLLNGSVTVASGGTLTIQPGAVLFGSDADNAAGSGSVDLLIVAQGGRIFADGTAAQPIIMTSAQDLLDDGLPNGTGGRSQWGGIAVNGRAPINDCTINPGAVGGTAACTKNGEGGSGPFGGDQPADNSGVLRFVRIQHAGFQFSSTNELNGLALQGVGNGTVVENIQIHNNGDDGIEFFGGTVNVRNIVLTGNDDDGFDWTDGWIGNAQFILAVQTGTNGDNGIEADNLGSNGNALPRSNPTLSNFTLISNNRTSVNNEGVQVRAGTNGRLINGVVSGFGHGLEFNAVAGAPVPLINAVAFTGNAVLGTDADDQTTFDAGAANVVSAGSTLNGVLPGPTEAGVSAINPTTLGSFFTAATYAGAFGGSDTATSNWTTGWTVPGSIPGAQASACPVGTTQTAESVPAGRTEARICRIPVLIRGALRLTAGNLYELDGLTFIGDDLGADPAAPIGGALAGTLTVDAGVTVFSSGRANGQDALTVSRGSQILANGSAVAPIVFTSREHLFNNLGDSGDWNGLSINGRAPINDCTVNPGATGGTVQCEKNGEAGTGRFGGATAADNSGRLNFVRIEFAGFQFSGTNEANSLQLQGVGSGTQIDSVQTLFGADDGVEWFGGTVNARNLVVVGAEDDSLDWTDGWNGNVQFAIVVQNNAFAINDNGIEADNLGSNNNALPRSNPTLCNLTMRGVNTGAANEGIQLRAGTDGRVRNVIVTGFGDGLDVTIAGGAPTPIVSSTVFSNYTTLTSGSGAAVFATGPDNIDRGNASGASTLTTRPGVTAALVPGANELTGVTVSTCSAVGGGSFFTPTTYVGAVANAADDWYVGWTRGF